MYKNRFSFYNHSAAFYGRSIPGFLNLGSAAPFLGFRGKIKKNKKHTSSNEKKGKIS
jgi:hypothetical protein